MRFPDGFQMVEMTHGVPRGNPGNVSNVLLSFDPRFAVWSEVIEKDDNELILLVGAGPVELDAEGQVIRPPSALGRSEDSRRTPAREPGGTSLAPRFQIVVSQGSLDGPGYPQRRSEADPRYH
jgi:hypothetical protein